MKQVLARAATAATLVLMTATGSLGAGARLMFRERGDAELYRLFVAQPNIDDELGVREIRIHRPKRGDHGAFYYDVHGIDPSRGSLFLMVSITEDGHVSAGSNIVEIGADGYCDIFDVDDNGRVTPTDALAVARKALGLKANVSGDGSIITALEILKVSATRECV